MLKFELTLSNIFAKEKFNNLFNKAGKITENKFWEFEILYYSKNLFEFVINLSMVGSDHAGIELEFGIFGLSINFKIYDKRHWDYENNKWEEYDLQNTEI